MISSRPIIYQRLQKLGEGTFSTVYKALRRDRDLDIEHVVALKILNSQIGIETWRDEFRALERVNSDRCVRVIGWDLLEGSPTLILEWVDGITLAELSRSHRISLPQIDEICEQIYEGLQSLNKAGLAHGDLSLQNIMITANGEIKLLDFGLSSTNLKMFTPEFAAPERLNQEKADARSDLYSLGRIREYLERREKVPISFTTKELTHVERENRRYILLFEMNAVERNAHQVALSRLVKESKAHLASDRLPQTEIESHSPSIWKNLLLLLLTTTALGSASATHDSREAYLIVRSKRWAEVFVDGEKKGFAPTEVRLRPNTEYKVQWRTANGRGQRALTLKPGQNMFIGDGFFK